MGKHEIAPSGEIWFKNQRVWRTLFSGALALLSVIPTALLIVHDSFPAPFWGAAAAQILAVQSVVTRVMAIPQVDAWLTAFGLGSAPRQ